MQQLVVGNLSTGSTVAKQRGKRERVRVFRGDRLRFLREQMQYSQDDLDRLLNFPPKTVIRYETGESDPLPAQLKTIAKALQVTSDYLIGLTDDPEGYANNRPTNPRVIKLLEMYNSGKLDELAYELLGEALYNKTVDSGHNTNSEHKDSTSDAA